MERQPLLVAGIVLVLVAGLALAYYVPRWGGNAEPSLEELEGEIVLGLEPGTYVTSPLNVTGRARAEWFNEAGEFSVTMEDYEGRVIGEANATATNEPVEGFRPFAATLFFAKPDTSRGVLVFQRSGAVGEDESEFTYGVTVLFEPPEE